MDRLTDEQRAWAESCWPMALWLWTPYAKRWPREADDLLEAATIGLLAASAKHKQGVSKFSNLACMYIKWYMQNELKANRRKKRPQFDPIDVDTADRGQPETLDEVRDEARYLAAGLPETNKKVMALLFADGITQREAAKSLGLSVGYVNQVKQESIAFIAGQPNRWGRASA